MKRQHPDGSPTTPGGNKPHETALPAIYIKNLATERIVFWDSACATFFGIPSTQAIGSKNHDLFSEAFSRDLLKREKQAIETQQAVVSDETFDHPKLGPRRFRVTRVFLPDNHRPPGLLLCLTLPLSGPDPEPAPDKKNGPAVGAPDNAALKTIEAERDGFLEQLRQSAVHDPLTQTLNRRGFQEELEKTWQQAQNQNHPVGLVLIDIDHFRSINHSHGHPAGDETLLQFAQWVQKEAGTGNVVGRYGGDEIAVILPACDEKQVREFMEKIHATVRTQVFSRALHDISLTISAGGSSSGPDIGGLSPQQVLTQADMALHQAKQAGRDRVCLYSEILRKPGQDMPAPHKPDAKAEDVFELNKTPDIPRGRGLVLLVDDDAYFCETFKQVLHNQNFWVLIANSNAEAVKHLKNHFGEIDLALVDLNLCRESGLDLLEQIKTIDDSVVRIVITGEPSLDRAISSIKSGAYDFAQKPFSASQIGDILDRALEHRRLLVENQRYRNHLEDMVRQKSFALSRALDEVRASRRLTLQTLAAMLNAREREPDRSSARISRLARILGHAMGARDQDLDDIEHGALLHDIGQIAVPDGILLRPEQSLSDEELRILRKHPETGHQILKDNPALAGVAEIILSHQELFDGSGYPRGLKRSEERRVGKECRSRWSPYH